MTLAMSWRAILVALCFTSPAVAATACAGHFAEGREPLLVNPKLAVDTIPLCFQAFGVLSSGLTRTPLWSAEHLTAAQLDGAHQTPRRNNFHMEMALPPAYRARISDYTRSGYDRGHMSPSGDMPNAEAQGESFSLANVVPQAPRLNRGAWEGVESAVRTLVQREGELYVVTGPVFAGTNLQALQNRVLIPTSVWKAVYNPRTGEAAVYYADNTDTATVQALSVAQLRTVSGIDAFPSLSEAVKQHRMALPAPTPYRGRGHR